MPRSLTLSTRLADLEMPSDLAERLPKALIHRNVESERIHALLRTLDRCRAGAAPFGAFGVRQRWIATVSAARDSGVEVLDGISRWHLGELTVPWVAVAPR